MIIIWLNHLLCNHLAQPYSQSSAVASFVFHESRKRSKYEDRVITVERGVFKLVVFSATGCAGSDANQLIRRVAARMALSSDLSYADCTRTIRSRLAFCLVRAASHYIHGYRRMS
ncbi:hypothetical protein GJ496_009663 [Pomphorhynchus laevis]|nr:hypothetical protein GJ496_009663 [Pomphorhynchus laevis]